MPVQSLTRERRLELDEAAIEFLKLHAVTQPPVPVEDILLHPAGDMWEPDLSDLSLQSFDVRERYSARPTIARLVARYVGQSDWARQRGLAGKDGFTPDEARYFGAALLMPGRWLNELHAAERDPASVRIRFQVPLRDATQRLAELFPPGSESKPLS